MQFLSGMGSLLGKKLCKDIQGGLWAPAGDRRARHRGAGAFSGNMLLWDKLPGGYERKFSGGEAEFDVE